MRAHGYCYMLRLNIRVISVTLLNAAVSGYVTTQQVRQALTQVLGRDGGGDGGSVVITKTVKVGQYLACITSASVMKKSLGPNRVC